MNGNASQTTAKASHNILSMDNKCSGALFPQREPDALSMQKSPLASV